MKKIFAFIFALIVFLFGFFRDMFFPTPPPEETTSVETGVETTSVTQTQQVHYAWDDTVELIGEHPHKTSVFTQGLFFHNGILYETGGMYGKSVARKSVDILTGEAEKEINLPAEIFAEGSVIFNDKMYVLTWRENKVLILSPETLEILEELAYPRQGWGLTTDGNSLIASDGGSEIFFLDENLNLLRSITVKDEGAEINRINELEYINGKIWANVWQTDLILIINPDTGTVEKALDFTGLYPEEQRNEEADVLNGIVFEKSTGKVYITGKYWDKMFEFRLK